MQHRENRERGQTANDPLPNLEFLGMDRMQNSAARLGQRQPHYVHERREKKVAELRPPSDIFSL